MFLLEQQTLVSPVETLCVKLSDRVPAAPRAGKQTNSDKESLCSHGKTKVDLAEKKALV